MGSYSEGGATVCITCAPGKVAEQAQPACLSCEPGKYANLEGLSSCSSCALDTFSSDSASTICTICPAVISDGQGSTLYIKDCRELCNTTDNVGQALHSGTCCMDAPIHSIVIQSMNHNLATLESQINIKALETFQVSQLVHLEVDENAWSAGLHEGNASRVRLYLMYGGFQLVRLCDCICMCVD